MSNMIDTAFKALLERAQTNRLLRLSFPNEDGPKSLMVANELNAYEGLSRDFHFMVEVISDDANIALKDIQGKMVTVELVREDRSMRYFNGYVFEFRLVKTDSGQAYYDMVLLPWLAYLRLRRDNYLFHGKNILDQTKEIFDDYKVHDSEVRIQGADEPLTDACQFDETDYNYLHRRWESRGWHYWYEHRKDGHTLVLADDSTQAKPIDGRPEIPYQKEAGSLEDDSIGHWVPVRRIVPSAVALTSFDFKNPHPLGADSPTINKQGDVLKLETYEYTGAYGFKNGTDGRDQSRLRMEEIEASGKHFEAAGNDRTALPGRWFSLTGHFDPDMFDNDPAREFLILDVRHEATNNYQTGGKVEPHYNNRLTCIRKIIPWRPARGYNSIEPKIYGLQTALVTGPSGEEIHTDEYGRVRVQFHWDRVGEYNEKTSAWVRVATAWSGPNFGMTSIPRIGTEVIVQFLDGNPDRPLITGMVPNAATMPPWELPANKTQSGILSRSTPGGGYDNANAIRFEDKKGNEQLWLHAEKDQLTEVEHDEKKWVGNDRVKDIDRDETSHIKRDRTETVDNDEKITIHNNRTERVDHNEKISIGDNRNEDVGQNETISIGANRTENVAQNESVSIGGNRSVTVGGVKTETVTLAKLETIGLAKMLSIGGAYQTNVGAAMNTTVALMQAEEVGLSKTVLVGKKFSITAGDELSITVGKASLLLKKDGTVLINGSQFDFSASGPVQITGKDVDIN
jgi:type VI secretion system secreted protein VgrG